MWSRRIVAFNFVWTLVSCHVEDGKVSRGPDAHDATTRPVKAHGDANSGQEPSDGKMAPAGEDPDDLAPYLLTHSVAKKLLDPLFLPVHLLPETDRVARDSFPKLAPVETYFRRFIREAIALDPFKPGREITVIVTDDTEINVRMDGWGQMTVNSAAVAEVSTTGLLATFCHELGHSARNHNYLIVNDPIVRTAEAQSVDEITAYWNDQFDKSRGIYTHDANRYAKLAEKYQESVKGASTFLRLVESEADVAGGRICGNLGMAIESYIEAMADVLDGIDRQAAETARVESLKDGDQLSVENERLFVWSFLFRYDDHPTTKERLGQLRRLSDIVAAERASRDFAGSWMKDYTEIRRTTGAGAALSGTGLGKAIAHSLDGSIVIRIRLPLN